MYRHGGGTRIQIEPGSVSILNHDPFLMLLYSFMGAAYPTIHDPILFNILLEPAFRLKGISWQAHVPTQNHSLKSLISPVIFLFEYFKH